MAVLLVAILLFAGIGFIVDRWWTLAVPLVVAPLYYLWLQTPGLGGTGVGDGWEYGLAIMIVLGVASGALGIVARDRWNRRRSHLAGTPQ